MSGVVRVGIVDQELSLDLVSNIWRVAHGEGGELWGVPIGASWRGSWQLQVKYCASIE